MIKFVRPFCREVARAPIEKEAEVGAEPKKLAKQSSQREKN